MNKYVVYYIDEKSIYHYIKKSEYNRDVFKYNNGKYELTEDITEAMIFTGYSTVIPLLNKGFNIKRVDE